VTGTATTRVLRFVRPFDLGGTLLGVHAGPDDPTCAIADGVVWRASRAPAGPCTLRLELRGEHLEARAWGEGAEAALDALPALVGAHDDDHDFVAHHPLIRTLHERFRGVRIPRSTAVAETLLVSILEQRVTAFEARRAHRQVVERWGEPAPGPVDLHLPPDPGALAGASAYDLHLAGVEQERGDVLRRLAASWRRLDALALLPPAEAHQRLAELPGVGTWSAARVALVALGDADAVPLGDPRLPADVTHALEGRAIDDDDAMLEALEPYRGHRGRVVRLLTVAGLHAPERSSRYAAEAPPR
jgi:3-methyladenine DNA glycosylase/8-oxoguanine DNA glycosylase